MAWRIPTLERILVNREFLQPWKNSLHDVFAEARANASYIDEMFIAIDSREQRAEAAAFAGPPAEHDFLPSAALGLGPIAQATCVARLAAQLHDESHRRRQHKPADRSAERDSVRIPTCKRVVTKFVPELGQKPFARLTGRAEVGGT